MKSERTWFDATAGHHATNAPERSCPVRSEREFDAPWWPHSGACGNGSPAALQAVSLGSSPSAPTNRRLVKRTSHERPKLEVAVRFRGRRPSPRRLMHRPPGYEPVVEGEELPRGPPPRLV